MIGTRRCIEVFTCISLLPIKVDVIRMKKLYSSEMNSSTYFCQPERSPEMHLSTKSPLNRTQSLKGRKSLSMYFLNPSLPTKHTPLITSTSPGNYENPPRINPMQKSVNQKSTVRNLLQLCNFIRFPGPLAWGRTAIHVKCHLTGPLRAHAFQISIF